MFRVFSALAVLLVWVIPIKAQESDIEWVRTYNGEGNGNDIAYAIDLDDSGNIYITGRIFPASAAWFDYGTIKYTLDGNQEWVKTYNGPAGADDWALAITVFSPDAIYVTGKSNGAPNYDFVTVKYDGAGAEQWVRGFSGAGGNDVACDIATDISGNIFVTGFVYSNPMVYTDYATLKYDPLGNLIWSRIFNGPANGDDSGRAVAVDLSGNVYVTGQVKFSSTPYAIRDYGTVKYDNNGNQIWFRNYNGPPNQDDHACDITTDNSGNIYVTGKSTGVFLDYATIKYASDASVLWVQRYSGPGGGIDVARQVVVDNNGNVYVTGVSFGGETDYDYATIKYTSDGAFVWVNRYNGPANSTDEANALALDQAGNIYVTGFSIGSGTGRDWLTIKYDPDGNTVWEHRYNGPGNNDDIAYDLIIDQYNNVFVTGSRDTTGRVGDCTTIKYWQSTPPGSFTLLAPAEGSNLQPPINFDWEDAVDNNPDDTVSYDLYVSTSPSFHPDSLVIFDHLSASNYSTGFPVGTYYWKVRAYDNHNLEAWSSQTWSFNRIPDSLPFASPVYYSVSTYPFALFNTDLDGDNDIDIAVSNRGSNSVSVLLNNGDGTFQPKTDYSTGNDPRYVFCADIDNDGDADIITANGQNNNVSVLLNNGDGIFTAGSQYSVGTNPYAVFCTDLDNDDFIDIVSANLGSDNISILLNKGDGTFQNQVTYPVGYQPFHVFSSDLDHDGDMDLAVANAESDNVTVYFNDGTANFIYQTDYYSGNSLRRLFCADLDNDNDQDMVVANAHGDDISTFLNYGNGTFQDAVTYVAGNEPVTPFCSDLDGDGDFDFVLANAYSHNLYIYDNYGDGTFARTGIYPSNTNPCYCFCSDLDGDGDFDMAVANEITHDISIFTNLTNNPANKPPDPFSLLSPPDGAFIKTDIMLDWQTPHEPNLGDQLKYDLYVSTAVDFNPSFTYVYEGLVVSRCSLILSSGTYYWKVRAYDNWGAETWSTESWRFTFVSSAGLVGYWKFEEGSGATAFDSSGLDNHGAIMGEPVWTEGVYGQALSLDGENDYVSVPDHSSLDITDTFTVMAWVYPRSLPGLPAFYHACFIDKGTNYSLRTGVDGARHLRLLFKDNNTTCDVESDQNVLTLNKWQHIAGSWDGMILTIHVDGEHILGSFYLMNAPDTNDDPLKIGAGTPVSEYFDGLVDEVKIYSRALAYEEIQNEYLSGCCLGFRGNVDCSVEDTPDISDITRLIDYLYLSHHPLCCPNEADADGSGGEPDIADITRLIDFLYLSHSPLLMCD